MQQRIISTDKGLSVITVRGDGERRIELSLDDCGDFIELRIGRNRNVTDTMAVTPDLARAVYDWLGKWLDAQDGEPPAKPYDPYYPIIRLTRVGAYGIDLGGRVSPLFCPPTDHSGAPMIYIGLHAILPPAGIYYTPAHLRQRAAPIVAYPPFCADILDAPTAPGKTLPATTIIERLRPED